MVSILTSEGYTLSEIAAQILVNLGGLTIHLPATPRRNSYSHDLVFDPDIPRAPGSVIDVEEWEQELGIRLFPVGYVTGAYPLWVAETGSFYYGSEFGLYSLGGLVRRGDEQADVGRHRPDAGHSLKCCSAAQPAATDMIGGDRNMMTRGLTTPEF